MNGTVERELKLVAPSNFSLARLPHELQSFVAAPAEFHRLHTVYYDTRELRLMRWGCSLRYRRGEGWTLKIPVPNDSKALVREEHVFEGSDGRVPQEALDLATAYLRGESVAPVAELRTLRISREFRNAVGTELAEVVEDDVRVIQGASVARRFRQIEIELEDGAEPGALDEIADALRSKGAGRPDPTPKEVLALAEGECEPEVAIPDLDARSPARDVVRAALAAPVIQLIRYDAKLRLAADAESLHQARVAVRKLRSNLRSFLPLLEHDSACALRERLRTLQDVLSPVRDLDVLIAKLQAFAEQLAPSDFHRASEILTSLREERQHAFGRLLETLRDASYIQLLNDVVEIARAPRTTEMADVPACDVVAPIISRAFKTARKAIRRASKPPSDREIHVIRIKSKHLRYTSEAFAPVVGRPARRFANKVKMLQTILGDQHDGVVAVARLREFSGPSQVVFVGGELAQLASEAGVQACRRWPDAWRKINRKSERFWQCLS